MSQKSEKISSVEEHLKKPLAERKKDYDRIQNRHPDRVPVMVMRSTYGDKLGLLSKTKFLVPKDISVGAFLFVLRNNLKLEESQSLFLFNDRNQPLVQGKTMAEIRQASPSDDGFLYLKYAGDTTMG